MGKRQWLVKGQVEELPLVGHTLVLHDYLTFVTLSEHAMAL